MICRNIQRFAAVRTLASAALAVGLVASASFPLGPQASDT